MLNIFLVLAFFIIVCLIEVPGLIRNQSWRDLAGFSIFLLPALIISLLQAVGIKLPKILPFIYQSLSPLLTWLGIS